MRMNGHHAYTEPEGHTGILIQISGQLGRVEATLETHGDRITRLEDHPHIQRPRRPMSEYIALLASMAMLAGAAFGKIAWHEALPSITGLVGH